MPLPEDSQNTEMHNDKADGGHEQLDVSILYASFDQWTSRDQ
jgi:hypothetical protein